MLCFQRRFCQSNNVFLICSLILAAGFIMQLKVLYNNHQKHLRIAEYRHRINELSEDMGTVERVANHTAMLFNKLKATKKMYKAGERKTKKS